MSLPTQAAPPARPGAASGFYGGVAVRDAGVPAAGVGVGVGVGAVGSAWSRYAQPVVEDAGSRALAYGGYRFANDVALEAAVSAADRYALTPASPGVRRGVGLALAPETAPARSWNVDLYTSWELRRSLALYGRLGYAQSVVSAAPLGTFTQDVRRDRDGMNYGVGLRYDVNSALGLRLEYGRFARLPGEFTAGALPEGDQVQFGVQYRF